MPRKANQKKPVIKSNMFLWYLRIRYIALATVLIKQIIHSIPFDKKIRAINDTANKQIKNISISIFRLPKNFN